jgi:hypothetical protein
MRAKEKKEQELERRRDEFFNKLRSMVPPRHWKAKAVSDALKQAGVTATEESSRMDAEPSGETKVNQSDWPGTPVRPIEGESD